MPFPIPELSICLGNSEVEKELGLLFSKGGNRRSGIGNQAKQSRKGTKFQMLVEDVRDGVLVSVLTYLSLLNVNFYIAKIGLGRMHEVRQLSNYCK